MYLKNNKKIIIKNYLKLFWFTNYIEEFNIISEFEIH